MDDLCQAEGVDNTIIQWASDFFVALFMFLSAFHLIFFGSNEDDGLVRKSGILAQIFMGGAFVLAGIGHWLYPNSGLDDDRGMLGFWIVWIGFTVFFTVSGLATAHFGMEAEAHRIKVDEDKSKFRWCWRGNDDNQNNKDRAPNGCNKFVPLCQLLLVLSLTSFLVGGIWCSVTPDLQVNEVLDDFESTSDIAICFQIMSISDVILYLSYGIMWIPVGLLLRSASRKSPRVILGLSTSVAAGTCILMQWSVGSMLVVYLAFTNFVRNGDIGTYMEMWNKVYGTVLFHWGMLVTFYCLHNVSCGLTLPPRKLMKKDKKKTEYQEEQEESAGWWDFDWLTATFCVGLTGRRVGDEVADETTDDEEPSKKTNPLADEADAASEVETVSETGSKKTVTFA